MSNRQLLSLSSTVVPNQRVKPPYFSCQARSKFCKTKAYVDRPITTTRRCRARATKKSQIVQEFVAGGLLGAPIGNISTIDDRPKRTSPGTLLEAFRVRGSCALSMLQLCAIRTLRRAKRFGRSGRLAASLWLDDLRRSFALRLDG